MATANPFDLLGDDDNDDPSQLLAAAVQKVVPSSAQPKKAAQAQAAPAAKSAKLPSKPLPPAQAGIFSIIFMPLFCYNYCLPFGLFSYVEDGVFILIGYCCYVYFLRFESNR